MIMGVIKTLIDIEKIIIKDRIRKDFGNIQELADDIKQNGLINPPVVNKDYELLAGERRLRACKSLGWNQIEVRMMDTRDAEHDFDVEVSENENRKDFSRTEREAIYTKRVEKRMKSQLSPIGLNSNEAEKEVAKEMGTSRTNMQREREILKNKGLLSPEDFADWDEGKLSTNKAFQKIKSQLAEKDRKIQELERDSKEREDYITELESREPEVKEVIKEVVPSDYEDLKKKAKEASAWEKDFHKQQEKVGEKQREVLELQNKIKELQEQTVREQSNNDMVASAIMFAAQCKNFIENVGGYVFLSEHFMELPERERKGYQVSAQAVHDWAQVILNNIERNKYELLGGSEESQE